MESTFRHNYASSEWLSLHFAAKSDSRLKEFLNLPIQRGDRVLDVGCGPGIFGSYISHMVGDDGRYVGVDVDKESIRYAINRLSTNYIKNWTFICSDFDYAIDNCAEFDVVLFSNSLSYARFPIDIVSKISSAMKRGSKIIIKDFDAAAIHVSPVDIKMWSSLIDVAMNKKYESDHPYNGFFGRKVPFIHEACSCTSYKNDIISHMMNYPYNSNEVVYINESIRMLVDISGYSTNSESEKYFMKMFSMDDGCFFKMKDSFFIENEFMTILTL